MMRSSTLFFIVAAITALLSIGLIWWYPSAQDYSPNNPFWNGLAQFTRDYHATVVNPASLQATSATGSLILIPRRVITSEELQRVNEFVQGGGTLVLLDDFGFGNQVAEGLGLKLRFSRKPLLDPLINQINQSLPKASFLPVGAQGRVSFVLNQPSSIEGATTEPVLASSSSFSYLDENQNNKFDQGEPTGPFTVATETSLGRGKIVLVSDPSILINGTLDVSRTFVDTLFQNKTVEILAETVSDTALDNAKSALYLLQGVFGNPIGLLFVLIVLVGLPLSFGRQFQGD